MPDMMEMFIEKTKVVASKYDNNSKSWQQPVGGDGSTRKTLDESAAARGRRKLQTQRFQNFQRAGLAVVEDLEVEEDDDKSKP